ncbi:unnamed protein product [Rotaria magnacalcarata]|uniref:Cytochrome P450 n=1 Tax=Rotaria magnacalcarata TaxID=392030 RepID=A0A815RJP9_9BILA|nr:unnamed protein product [Rotaria magnacalcarata]CAF1476804.1 unnamed protein product [Rotaria magnacalcarata]CAF2141695.1 unnamed protein product [Rotaria magnacalcarata]CAF3914266.1 unnamed protein product [Rotaria magnacalcarata]CAF3925219.1 unnamed protein product [Rotaria magnacalcarata]
MWLTISFYTLLFYVIYRLIKFWIIHPWLVQRDFSNQGIPGHYTPIVGDILDRRRAFLADELLNYIEETSVKLGDYYHTSLGPFPCLTISDPALVESVLKTNSRSYHKAQLARAIVSTILGYENVLLAEDENHTRRRRLLNPVFQHQNINSMISLMVDITSKFSTKWRIKTDEQTYPLICDISKEMSNLTLDIITGCVFGVEVMNDKSIHETIYKSLKIALDEIEKRIYNLIILIPILNQLPIFGKRTIDKCRQDIKNITLQVINQRKQGLTKATWPDLLDLIFAACDDDNKQKFTDDEVADEAMTFVLAGHETTATLITWALYNIVTNLDVYQRCQNEVDSVLSANEELTVAAISQLTYTEAVLKETLRSHQPAPFLYRTAIVDNIIVASDGKQIHIRKGVDIAMNLNVMNSSEKYWHEPKKFDPSRFLQRNSNVIFPFGSGPRACIGQNFAMLEAKIMLTMLLHQFRFELVPGQKLVQSTAVTIRPKYGLSMRVWPR